MSLFKSPNPIGQAKRAAGADTGTAKAGSVAGGVIAGVALLGAAALAGEWLRERSEREPSYDTLREDGAISLRRYRSMVVATADANGSMKDALDSGFRRLFAYISGKVRPSGDDAKIAMTVPVLAAQSDHPGGWLVRFVMPQGKPIQALPQPGPGVRIDELPERVIAAIRFPGRITDRQLAQSELAELRAWIDAQGLTAKSELQSEPQSEATFAAYNSPIIPGPLRRNEWWIEVAEPSR